MRWPNVSPTLPNVVSLLDQRLVFSGMFLSNCIPNGFMTIRKFSYNCTLLCFACLVAKIHLGNKNFLSLTEHVKPEGIQ